MLSVNSVILWSGIAILCIFAKGADIEPLQLFTENAPPNNYLADDGKTVLGTATLKIQAAMARSKVPYTIIVTDWSRALNLAARQQNACVYSTARLAEREALFQWVSPVARASWYLWGKADGAKPTSIEEVRGKVVCDLLNNAGGRFLVSNGFTVAPSQSHEICIENVRRGLAQYWSANLYFGKAEVARLGYQDEIVPLLEFGNVDLYLACNSAVAKTTVEALRKAFQSDVPL